MNNRAVIVPNRVKVNPGRCDPWMVDEGQRPAHYASALYAFVRDEPGIWESRLRCWRHRPEWAR